MADTAANTAIVKEEAAKAGFDFCGVAEAAFLEDQAPLLEQWLNQGMHGEMAYMERWFDMRLDPRKLVPGAKSIICLTLNYFPEQPLHPHNKLKFSKYAYGRDYHKVIKKKLKALVGALQERLGRFEARIFTDSAPVLEKAWAVRAGIGWQGKNANVINPKAGSFFFLAEIISDLALQPDAPMRDYCGTCRRCIDACPTQAIAPYVVDGSKCISYFTIELKKNIPAEYADKLDNWVFGCDICQDVCPWNRFSRPHRTPEFLSKPELAQKRDSDWLELTREIFDSTFEGSAVKRAGYEGLARNIAAALRK